LHTPHRFGTNLLMAAFLKRDSTRNLHRFYTVALRRDLFDGWRVVREWGRLGSPGTVRELHCATEAEALAVLDATKRQRVARGYTAAASPN
jgi:predicted DNA-binding WGR domain protein